MEEVNPLAKLRFPQARMFAEKNSVDPSRKTGCVLIVADGDITAANTFPAGVHVTPDRLERPHKYAYTEHAERNAIYMAARFGHRTAGAAMYLPWFPCADCARAIVCAGIRVLYCIEPDWTEERYGFQYARTILQEGGVIIEFQVEDEGEPQEQAPKAR